MKKVLLVLCLILCLLVSGCGNEVSQENIDKNSPVVPENTESAGTAETGELQEPVMEWWELYNPNGFDTLTAILTNPNDVSIDASFDLVFYKDGSEVSRIEGCYCSGILPGAQDILWDNAYAPKSEDADDVKMENIQVTEAYYPPVPGSYEFIGTEGNEAHYHFEFDSPITMATIWLLQYNDMNGNKKCDKGEIVVADLYNLMDQEGDVYHDIDVFESTDCDVYFKAY